MKLQFLGTGAADWGEYNPANPDSRGFAAALIDDKILIDCGPTIVTAIKHFGIDMDGLSDILITHSHSDHFDLDLMRYLAEARKASTPLNVCGPLPAVEQINDLDLDIITTVLQPGDEVEILGNKITALAANHETQHQNENALHYFFDTPENKNLLYALDGAWFTKPTWEFLWKKKLDCIIWDFTIGDTSGDWRIFEHNSLEMLDVMTKTFKKEGVFHKDTQVLLSHMAKTLCSPREVLTSKLLPYGFRLAFDGDIFEV